MSLQCIASGIATLWGPAHGGANEAVIKMLEVRSHNMPQPPTLTPENAMNTRETLVYDRAEGHSRNAVFAVDCVLSSHTCLVARRHMAQEGDQFTETLAVLARLELEDLKLAQVVPT